jgi:hypothetical protein
MLASEVLELQKATTKLTAKLIIAQAVNSLMELDKKIKSLPED